MGVVFEKAVFAVGRWTDGDGRTQNWTLERLATIVRMYSQRANKDAPICLGHPETNSPAYGWVKKLYMVGEVMYASIESNADNKIVDWLRKGYYREVSISVYDDGELNHIGFLGGARPAVPGLPDANLPPDVNTDFARYGGTPVTVSAYSTDRKPSLFSYTPKRSFSMDQAWLDELTAWRTATDDRIAAAEGRLDAIEGAAAGNAGADAGADAGAADNTANHAAPDPRLTSVEARLEASEKRAALAEFNSFLDSPEMQRKVSPAMRTKLVEGFEKTAAVTNFSAGEPPAILAYRDSLKLLPDSVPSVNEYARNGAGANLTEVDALWEKAEALRKL